MCATPRSASTLLCALLAGTGVAGRPEEYFECLWRTGAPRQPREYVGGVDDAAVLALLAPTDPGGADRSDPFPPALARGTTPNGVFGAKLMWTHLLDLADRLERSADPALLAGFLVNAISAAMLNEFFEAVVVSVHDHQGLVNKFEGDAALCVFGAPVAQADHAARALACARELRGRIDALECGLDAAIGVACGPVVAGYVGAEARFEYSVIGDPVNEAARLTELAKQHDERLLVSGDIVDRAGGEEAARWCADGEVVLRGRERPTRTAVPVSRPALQ